MSQRIGGGRLEMQPNSRTMRLPLEVLEQQIAHRNRSGCLHPAVFLDRDGTINVERGYLLDPAEVALLPTVGKAIRLLNRLNVPVVVITNQSALERHMMRLADLEAVNAAILEALREANAHYDALYYCPHRPDRVSPCACRKPKPGLLLQAALDLDLDLRRCFMVGDKRSDLDAARRCGCHTVLVRTGWGEDTYIEVSAEGHMPDYVTRTLLEAVNWIVTQLRTHASDVS